MTDRLANFTPNVGQMALTAVRAAWPVAAEPVKAACQTVNWLLSRGTALTVDGGHTWYASGGTQTRTLNYYFRVDNVHHSLGVTLTISTQNQCVITIFGQQWVVSNRPSFIHFPFPNVAGNSELGVGFTIQWEPEATIWVQVHSVAYYECPQVLIEESGAVTVQPRTQVYDGYDERKSIAGLARATEELRATYFRRGTLFTWTKGTPDGVNTGLFADYVSLFPTGFGPALQTRLMYQGETTRACRCSVYARVSPGGHGQVKLRMTNGSEVIFDITNSTNAWQTSQALSVETDDPSTWEVSGGIRGGSRDVLSVGFKSNDGDSGTLYLLGIAIWDPPG